MTFAQRAASAKAEETEGLLRELYERGFGVSLEFDRQQGALTRYRRFQQMIDAGAFVDAALMLVPEGYGVGLQFDGSAASADLLQKQADIPYWTGHVHGATPALALIAAIAQSKGL